MDMQAPKDDPSPLKKLGGLFLGIGLILAKFGKAILIWLKVVLPGLKFAKLGLIFGKVFTTGGTMLLSIWYYAQLWGWKYAVGFVFAILIHELGHVYAAYQQGIPVSAPVFIPGMGAMILHKSSDHSVWSDAEIGYGGPLWGVSMGVFYLIGANYFSSPLLQALAYTTFLLNLFNLMPIMPLDGGWITRAVSPRLWIVGVLGMGGLMFTGHIRNPLVFILILAALPQVWRGLRYGHKDHGQEGLSNTQRMKMGLKYIGLVAVTAWLMGEAHLHV